MATYESKKYAFSGANLSNINATGIADGSVDNTEYQFINSLSSNAQTQITGRLQTAGGTMTGSIVFPDDRRSVVSMFHHHRAVAFYSSIWNPRNFGAWRSK